ncbi:MAG: flagellar motor switch protein FliM [Bdellovibrionales bacterium]|nr:flagellar motor switch protein FliM [Bdellovibrionales bacterium]
MNQVLSQSEVDALLNAVMDPSVSTGGDAAAGAADAAAPALNIMPYDLGNQDRVIRGRMMTLDIIYERFIRLFRVSLSTALRKIASLSIISTDLLKFGEFLNTLPIPSCMGVMRFDTLRGSGMIVIESKLVYALVDAFFGGSDRPYTKSEGKEFTRIELSVINKVIELALKDLDEAWAPVHKTDISFVRIEVNPQFVGLVPPSDVVISTTFEVELEHASGTVAVVVPYATLEPIKEKLNAGFQPEGDRFEKVWTQQLHQHLAETGLNCKVNLGETTLTVGDLVNLSVGDIIPLTQDADGELDLIVEGTPKYKCMFGVSRGNRAIQVTRPVAE